MRNLVVASLDTSGNIIGIPQCYPTSVWPLALINGYPAEINYATTIRTILVNSAKSRLYMGEDRMGPQPTSSGLNVYTLDVKGNPIDEVRTYPFGTIYGLVMHPALPQLYIVGPQITGVGVQALDSDGEPIKDQLTVHTMGQYGKYSIGISADAKYLYFGTIFYNLEVNEPLEALEVVELDSEGIPTGAFKSYPVSNSQIGTVKDYLRFTMGTHTIYMVRPNPSGGGLPILALWPLDSTTGQPIDSALARTDINPPLVGANAMTIAVDNANSRLWVANPTTFADVSGAIKVSGIRPTSYHIKADGTLGDDGAAGQSFSEVSNAAVLAPTSNSGSAVFFNGLAPNNSDLVKGYQCRVIITAVSGGSPPLTVIAQSTSGLTPFPFGRLSLNTPSEWHELDSWLRLNKSQVAIRIVCTQPTTVTSMTVQFDLADASGKILKSVTETVQSGIAVFLMPGYSMSATALTGSVTGMETYSQRCAEYLSVAKLNPVSAVDRPKKIITDCFSLRGEASNTVLTNLAQTMQLLGFNTVNADLFDGLRAGNINSTLCTYGLDQRSSASYRVGTYNDTDLNGLFSFEMTTADLAKWAQSMVSQVNTNNGGSPLQIVSIHMCDEPGWLYPDELNTVNGSPKYLQFFQNYLQQQGNTYGLRLHIHGPWGDQLEQPQPYRAGHWKPVEWRPSQLTKPTALLLDDAFLCRLCQRGHVYG
jgi:hypothetical protein